MEGLVSKRAFWAGKKVLVTGHTGFKGGWLSLWLQHLGAQVVGYALPPGTQPALFHAAQLGQELISIEGDVRDLAGLDAAMEAHAPDVVFHLAAQSLVRESYQTPVETYATNVMGTVHVLDAVRRSASVRAVVVVTSDKCYENREWERGYREDDAMGGYDPYSSSKGCAELVTSAYTRSFLNRSTGGEAPKPAVASARAGNVIGGGDWSQDRLIPDIVQAFSAQQPVHIRNPSAIRPWQHVLEPLHGYLLLAERLWQRGDDFSGGWNFGPPAEDARPVDWVVSTMVNLWRDGATWTMDTGAHPHEAKLLRLDASKSQQSLGWLPRLPLPTALAWTVAWYRAHQAGVDMRRFTLDQIAQYEQLTRSAPDAHGQVPLFVPAD